jgi:phosphatidate phosphatase APP1
MKSVPANLLSPRTWRALYALTGDATVEQKITQISTIIGHFPGRRFILVGDSGEHDPEVYATLRETFGDRIAAIWIRDVVDARHLAPRRLEGMQVIEAPTVTKEA